MADRKAHLDVHTLHDLLLILELLIAHILASATTSKLPKVQA